MNHQLLLFTILSEIKKPVIVNPEELLGWTDFSFSERESRIRNLVYLLLYSRLLGATSIIGAPY